jgi:secondary thiamine-phosphate synthase enzyme
MPPAPAAPTALRQALGRLEVATRGGGASNVTALVDRWLTEIDAGDGLLTLFLRHTSASLTVQENASPEVLPDLSDALDRMAPRDHPWRHDQIGRASCRERVS